MQSFKNIRMLSNKRFTFPSTLNSHQRKIIGEILTDLDFLLEDAIRKDSKGRKDIEIGADKKVGDFFR